MDVSTSSLGALQLEIQLETVRRELEASAAAAQAAREQLAADYETRLRLVRVELKTTHVHRANLERKVQREAAERLRILAALRTVQQACAGFEDTESSDAEGEPVREGQAETPAPGGNEQARTLELVTSAQPARKDPPPELVVYLKELFDQMESTYWLDHRAHASIEVVDRLGANLRYAHEAFLRRAGSDVEMGADVFGSELMARMDAHGADSLGRHLAIASYELPGVTSGLRPGVVSGGDNGHKVVAVSRGLQ